MNKEDGIGRPVGKIWFGNLIWLKNGCVRDSIAVILVVGSYLRNDPTRFTAWSEASVKYYSNSQSVSQFKKVWELKLTSWRFNGSTKGNTVDLL